MAPILRTQVGHKMINNEEKIKLLQEDIQNLNFHIHQLEEGIANSPDSDIEGKIPRSENLLYLQAKKQVLQEELESLG